MDYEKQNDFLRLGSVFILMLFLYSIGFSGFSPVYEKGEWLASVTTAKARYSPGDTVTFFLKFHQSPGGKTLKIRYLFLNQLVAEQQINLTGDLAVNWAWLAPAEDYRGYLVEIGFSDGQSLQDQINIAVDVSSGWQKFPRYGFLSKFPLLTQSEVEDYLNRLTRFHINGLQFYDWHHKHHWPLKGTPENPAYTWNDIANRTIYFATLKRYIDTAHQMGMKAMAYNLLYGAWEDAHLDGVSQEWRLFRDTAHSNPDKHDLPDSWASDIYLMDPSNQQWRDYIISKTADIFPALPFDGWHIDQLGNRGSLYNYYGGYVNLENTFQPFIQAAKESLGVDLVMNAVNQYGQSKIAAAPVDFLYTEVWDPNNSFSHLASIITHNYQYSNGKLQTVLAAYVNKGLSNSPGFVNTPAVLFANAVIFAAGGAHLELGEHYLANEYFPNDNLQMSPELQLQLLHYYDFLVAYQNLLRDGGEFNTVPLQSGGSMPVKSLAQLGTVWAFSKIRDHRQVFHLINFTTATTLDWRDNSGIQTEPDTLQNIALAFEADRQVQSIWCASPDFSNGSPVSIDFSQTEGQVDFLLPRLKYWTMIVVEYENSTGLQEKIELPDDFHLGINYPNPFNPVTHIPFSIKKDGQVRIDIFDNLGRHIQTLVDERMSAGSHRVTWQPSPVLSSGIYHYRLSVNGKVRQAKKMVLMK